MFESLAYLTGHIKYVFKVEVSFFRRWCADGDKRYIRSPDCFFCVSCCSQAPGFDNFMTKFGYIFFYNCRSAIIDEVYFILRHINADNLVSKLRKTNRADTADISESEKTDIHSYKCKNL